MNGRTSIPGRRTLAATLDSAGGDSVVVACPPHPEHGGNRHDSRLQAVSDALAESNVDCLRFDYGPWDEGRGEQQDVKQAMAWARERYESVAVFGFSFGASMAILASATGTDGPHSDTSGQNELPPDALSALAPAAQVDNEGSVVDALSAIRCPTQVVYGERDDIAVWEPVVDRARELGYHINSLPADHFFVGQQSKAAELVVSFLLDTRQ